ncbi:MAG: hypothetical protein AAB432_00485 [Patescibacteria group bacterium]
MKKLFFVSILLLCFVFLDFPVVLAQTRPVNSFSDLIKAPWNYKSSDFLGTARTFTDGIVIGKARTYHLFSHRFLIFVTDSSALSHCNGLRGNLVIELSVSQDQYDFLKTSDIIDATGWVYYMESPKVISDHYLETGAASINVKSSINESSNFDCVMKTVYKVLE